MLFNTIPFLIFFSFVYFIYWNIAFRFRHRFLILSASIFYFYNSPIFLIHIFFVIGINFLIYRQIYSGKKNFVKIAVVFNLVNLGFFKYFYFFINFLFDITGFEVLKELGNGTFFKISLPLAISYYSFQIISIAVDTNKDEIKSKAINLLDYTLYILFFPVLIAGPIMKRDEFFPNLERKNPEADHIYKACFLMMSGLIKKILIADPMAAIVNPMFSNPSEYNSLSLFFAGICYTIQLYGDFSGLTDMARSVSYFLGFEIPENFYAPFFSTSVKEFWKRWHVTLSNWLMEYIYFPLGGSRLGEFRTYLNLIITMTLGGLWHGSDYTFITWGFYLGIVLSIERIYEKWRGVREESKNIFIVVLRVAIVHALMSISVLMFRSNNPASMIELFVGLVKNSPELLRNQLIAQNQIWILQGIELIQTEKSFMLSSVKNIESAFYMYFTFVIFHYIQYKPEVLNRFQKYRFPLVIVLGVLTIFLLTTLSNEGDGFVYTQF
jgi:D-alanyl-lipoteichoic acid acyltransferase DltB (MBOAT superfamily)